MNLSALKIFEGLLPAGRCPGRLRMPPLKQFSAGQRIDARREPKRVQGVRPCSQEVVSGGRHES